MVRIPTGLLVLGDFLGIGGGGFTFLGDSASGCTLVSKVSGFGALLQRSAEVPHHSFQDC